MNFMYSYIFAIKIHYKNSTKIAQELKRKLWKVQCTQNSCIEFSNWFVFQRHWYKKTYTVLQNVNVRKSFPNEAFQKKLTNEDQQLVPHRTQKAMCMGEGQVKKDKNKWEKIFASYTSDRDFMPRINKEFKNQRHGKQSIKK